MALFAHNAEQDAKLVQLHKIIAKHVQLDTF